MGRVGKFFLIHNAMKDILYFGFFPTKIVNVIGCYELNSFFLRCEADFFICFLLFCKTMILYFEVKIFFAENICKFVYNCFSFGIFSFQKVLCDFSANTSGKTNKPFMIFPKKSFVYTGLIIHVFCCDGNELDEVLIPFVVFCKENEMIVVFYFFV